MIDGFLESMGEGLKESEKNLIGNWRKGGSLFSDWKFSNTVFRSKVEGRKCTKELNDYKDFQAMLKVLPSFFLLVLQNTGGEKLKEEPVKQKES